MNAIDRCVILGRHGFDGHLAPILAIERAEDGREPTAAEQSSQLVPLPDDRHFVLFVASCPLSAKETRIFT
jgi:hypothetical protein